MLRVEPSTPLQTLEKSASNDLQSLEDAPLEQLNLDAAICEALARCGMSHEQACLTMGVDQSLWTKQRRGDGHVSLQRLMKLPRRFWLELFAILGAPLDLVIGHPQLADRLAAALLVSVQHAIGYAQQDRLLRAERRIA